MTEPTTAPRRPRREALAVVLLALLAMGIGIGNQWAQDDIPIIATGPAVHWPTWEIFRTAYWPPPYSPDLYRPLSTLLYALQWFLGGHEAWPVHATSLALYAGLCVAVLGLARRLMPPHAAWGVAALFAVHPLHVEAVAVGVNQSELVVAAFLVVALSAWIDARRAGRVTPRFAIGLAVFYGIACLFKEIAIVLPGLLAVAEATVLREVSPRPWRVMRPLGLGLVLVAEAFVALRMLVLRNFAGTFTAEALNGLGLGGRTLTMLGVVPEWLRLLAWPARLQADYSPREIMPAAGLGPKEALGLLLVAGTVALLVRTWRRAPTAAFGILWFVVAIGPVANILVPTGIVLAERTLLLPSVGFMLMAGIGLDALGRAIVEESPARGRLVLGSGLVVLLGLGIGRSLTRTMVWNNNDYLWLRTVEDAPLSYRAHHAVARFYFANGRRGQAEQHFRTAMALYPRAFQVEQDLADHYRRFGFCEPAIPLYRDALKKAPALNSARASLISCYLWLGQYERAERLARLGAAWQRDKDVFDGLFVLADSARRAGAPPRTVRGRLPARAGADTNSVVIGTPGGPAAGTPGPEPRP